MEGFTLIDAGVAVVIVVSAILAYARGFVREVMSILGWIAAAVFAFLLAPVARPLILEIPGVGGLLADSCELGVIAAFAAVFALGLVLAALFTPMFSSMVRRSPLAGLDMGMGFLFGVARGALLVVVALIAYEQIMTPGAMPMIDESRSAAVFARLQEAVAGAIPADAPDWIVARYESLVSVCGG